MLLSSKHGAVCGRCSYSSREELGVSVSVCLHIFLLNGV